MCPIFDLHCEECNKTYEEIVAYEVYKKEEFYCSKCGNKLIKQLSGCGFVLKGKGFYKPSID